MRAFLLLIANLAWTCDPLGLLAAIATNAVRARASFATP